VTITGANLAGVMGVDFGSTHVTSFLTNTATQITLFSPAGTGTVDVSVMTPAGTSAMSTADRFSYFRSLALPTSVSMVSGSEAFGRTATLRCTLTAGASPLAGRTITFALNERGTLTTVGTATTDANGVATLTGVRLTGLNAGTYSGAVGASFAGDSTFAGSSASGALIVNPAMPLIIFREQPLFHRKTNTKGKASGGPVLIGFVFDFSDALNPLTATARANYEVDTVATKRVKKHSQRILHPIKKFSVAYSAANDSVTLTFASKQTFPTGGQITVVGGTPSGVTGVSGAALVGTKMFAIAPRGRSIVPQ
jgi:hypothetical protein